MAEVFHFVKKIGCTGLPRDFYRCVVSTGYLLVWILAGGNERSPTYKCKRFSTKLRNVPLALHNCYQCSKVARSTPIELNKIFWIQHHLSMALYAFEAMKDV